MTTAELQAKYPAATITAGISALHFEQGDVLVQIRWAGLDVDREAVVADMDRKVSALIEADVLSATCAGSRIICCRS